MNKKPLVSIVTPSYNQGVFIEDTILSVKNQDYPRVEHIVVDGGSTDKTLSILKKYEHEYNLFWVSEVDNGQSDAVNKGFEKASGEIIGWVNSDDLYFDRQVFEDIVRLFEKWGEVDVIYGDLAVIDENNLFKRVRHTIPWFSYDRLLVHDFINQPSTFFRRKIIDNYKLDEDIDLPMDYDFWIKIAKEGAKFKHFDRIVACHRMYENAKTQARLVEMAEESKRLKQRYGQTFGFKYFFGLFADKSIMAFLRIKGLREMLRIYSNKREYDLAFEPKFDSIIKTIASQLLYPSIQI